MGNAQIQDSKETKYIISNQSKQTVTFIERGFPYPVHHANEKYVRAKPTAGFQYSTSAYVYLSTADLTLLDIGSYTEDIKLYVDGLQVKITPDGDTTSIIIHDTVATRRKHVIR